MLLFVGGELLLSLSCSSEAVESELGASFSSLPLLSHLLFPGAQGEDLWQDACAEKVAMI